MQSYQDAPADDGSGACKPTQQLQGLNMRYTTHGPGTIACQEGRDVAYPPGAPGYQDDPTGHFNTTSAGKVLSLASDQGREIKMHTCMYVCTAMSA